MRVCPRCRATTASSEPVSRCPEDGTFHVSSEDLARSDGDPILGTAIEDRFVVLGVRAFGARGTVVYRAHDLAQKSASIVKLTRHPSCDTEAYERLAFERRVLDALPGQIAPRARAHGSFRIPRAEPDADTASYLASDVVAGRCLIERSFAPTDLPRLAAALARAVAGVHAAAQLHGDLKPEHFFHDGDVAQLIDFGAVAPPPRMTPAFLAPEATAPSAAADIYALGCTLYWCVAGRPPFQASTLEGLRRMHLQAPIPDVEAAEPLRSAIQGALCKAPTARPTATELVSAFALGAPA